MKKSLGLEKATQIKFCCDVCQDEALERTVAGEFERLFFSDRDELNATIMVLCEYIDVLDRIKYPCACGFKNEQETAKQACGCSATMYTEVQEILVEYQTLLATLFGGIYAKTLRETKEDKETEKED